MVCAVLCWVKPLSHCSHSQQCSLGGEQRRGCEAYRGHPKWQVGHLEAALWERLWAQRCPGALMHKAPPGRLPSPPALPWALGPPAWVRVFPA